MTRPDTHDPMLSTRLEWRTEDRFEGTVGGAAVRLDGGDGEDASPMQVVAAGLAGCMAIDVRMILNRGRQPLEALTTTLEARRADEPPRRFVEFKLHFIVRGYVAAQKLERAIELSVEKYCSVWHSLDHGAELTTSYEIATD
ncbi:MAG: OsmC family protein [Acidobacteriota bacterium]